MYTSVKCHGGTLTHTYLTARFIIFWSPSVAGEIDKARVWGKVWKAVHKICISPYKAHAEEMAGSSRAVEFLTQTISCWYSQLLILQEGLKNKCLAVQSLPWPKVDVQLADSSDLSFDKHYKYQYVTLPRELSKQIPTTHLMSEVEKSGGHLVSEEFRLGALHGSWVRTTCSSLQTTPPKDQQKRSISRDRQINLSQINVHVCIR